MQPTIDRRQLLALQDESFRLQREAFLVRPSCRELLTSGSTQEQWSDFALIAAEDPQIAGPLDQ